MRGAIVLLIGLGLVAALAATVLVSVLIESLGRDVAIAPPATEPADVTLLVARADLPTMRVLRHEDLELATLPRDEAPAGALSNPMQAVGKVLAVPMVQGQLFTSASFISEGTGMHLAAALPEGKRAVNVSLADHSGLEGLLYPGSVVDVYVTFLAPADEDTGRHKQEIAATLLEQVQVLGVNYHTIVSNEEQSGTTTSRINQRLRVTLLVDPPQAMALQLATQHGSVSLAMRNPLDQLPLESQFVSLNDLAGDERDDALSGVEVATLLRELPAAQAAEPVPAPAPVPAPTAAAESTPARRPAWETTIIRGLEVELREFPLDAPLLPTAEPTVEPQASPNLTSETREPRVEGSGS